MADKIVVMSHGRVEQVGAPHDIYHKPENAFVADFIGKANFFDGVVEKGGVRVGATLLEMKAANGFLAGSPVQVAFRPEMPHLDAAEAPGTRLAAKITFVRDVGPVRDIHLETDIGAMVVEYAGGEADRSFAVGQQVTVTLPRERLLAFPRTEGVAA